MIARGMLSALARASLLPALALAGCVGALGADGVAGPTSSADGTTCDGDCVGATPIAAITREEYGNSVRDVLGAEARIDALPSDGTIDAFFTNTQAVRGPDAASAYELVATEVADAAAPALASSCPDASCVDALVRARGALLYRRPLADDEAQALGALYDVVRAETGHVDGLAAVVAMLLQSPDFLYRVERGVGAEAVRPLTGDEVAGRLAAFLWRSVPDEALLAAAAAGRLDTDEGLHIEVRRMIADVRFERAVRSFHEEWLGAAIVAPRDGLDPEIVAQMREELSRYTIAILRSDRPTLQHLLTERDVPLSATLAAHYGVDAPASEWANVPMPERAGILGRGLPIVAATHSSDTRAIHRGLLVYRRLLCRAVGAPPAAAASVTAAFHRDPAWTDREYVTHLTLDQPQCAGCHGGFNPLGFAFEAIDPLGRPEAGHPDTSGTLDDMPFGSLVDLEGLLSDGEVEDCAIRRWLGFALGRTPVEADLRSLEATGPALRTGTGALDLLELVERVTLARTFRARRFDP